MKNRLTQAQSRFLALALLLLVILGAVGVVAVPTMLLHKHYDTAMEDYSDRLQRYRRVAGLRSAIENAMKTVEARAAGGHYYLKGASAASAAAELQGLVTRVIETQGGRIMSSQALPAKDGSKPGEPAKASMSVQMNASVPSLRRILHGLETSQPYLFVDQLVVRSPHARGYKPVPGVEPEFVVTLTVSGFTPAGTGKP